MFKMFTNIGGSWGGGDQKNKFVRPCQIEIDIQILNKMWLKLLNFINLLPMNPTLIIINKKQFKKLLRYAASKLFQNKNMKNIPVQMIRSKHPKFVIYQM